MSKQTELSSHMTPTAPAGSLYSGFWSFTASKNAIERITPDRDPLAAYKLDLSRITPAQLIRELARLSAICSSDDMRTMLLLLERINLFDDRRRN